MGTIISAIVDGILSSAVKFLNGILEKRQLVKQGQAQQAAAETTKTEQKQADMAQAEAESPKTKQEALDRLRDGTA